jgi:PleD family two-component response regulator
MIAIAKTGGTPVEILIAEDSPTQALQLQHILEEQGSQPSTQHLTARTTLLNLASMPDSDRPC